MTVSSTSSHVVDTGNGATTSFPFVLEIEVTATRHVGKTAQVRR